jgi:hypothetical protein
VMQVAAEPFAEPMETALVSALVLATLGTLGRFLYETWRWILPATVTIDAKHVSYRGLSVQTAAVIEVVSAGAIYIVTPRRVLEIPAGFCTPASTPRVLAELRRVIVEKSRLRQR